MVRHDQTGGSTTRTSHRLGERSMWTTEPLVCQGARRLWTRQKKANGVNYRVLRRDVAGQNSSILPSKRMFSQLKGRVFCGPAAYLVLLYSSASVQWPPAPSIRRLISCPCLPSRATGERQPLHTCPREPPTSCFTMPEVRGRQAAEAQAQYSDIIKLEWGIRICIFNMS